MSKYCEFEMHGVNFKDSSFDEGRIYLDITNQYGHTVCLKFDDKETIQQLIEELEGWI